ncbi:MAG: hypothetical protein LQ342_008481 [Letrouitia transgressa]|nr:MAG: hypothetical protein LQ342_008481 [Letrouitia transgressa]
MAVNVSRSVGNNTSLQQASSPPTIKLLKILSSKRTAYRASPLIECELFKSLLYSAPPYETLSYTWGSNSRDCPICVHTISASLADKSSFSSQSPNRSVELRYITSHLQAALIKLRRVSEDRVVWIDQLCIDQSNVEERNAQVALMAGIYRNAQRTIIWLGSGNILHQDEAFIADTANRMNFRPLTREISSIHDQDLLKKLIGFGKGAYFSEDGMRRRRALAELLNRSWFMRAWVFQEAVVSKTSQIICGGLEMDFDIFINLLDGVCALDNRDIGLNQSILRHSTGYEPVYLMRATRFDHREATTWASKHTLLSILWQAQSHFQASDPRDKVYAFLAFQDDFGHGRIRPAYEKSVAYIYTDAAARIIRQTGLLDILELASKDCHSLSDLPSWVPDFSKPPPSLPFIPHNVSGNFEAAKDTRHYRRTTNDDWQSLWVQGIIVDRLKSICELEFEDDGTSETLNEYLKLSKFKEWAITQRNAPCSPLGDPTCWPKEDELEQKLLRTLLAEGAKGHGALGSLNYDSEEVLDAYRNEQITLKAKNDGILDYSNNSSDSETIRKFKRRQHCLVWMKDIARICRNKKIFLSENFYFGLAYREIHEGDLICILDGSRTPTILRECASNENGSQYRFIAQCYLDGWMQGVSSEDRTLQDDKTRTWKLV